MYVSCSFAPTEKPSGGIKLAEFHFSPCIDCASTDVSLPLPGKVRVCSAMLSTHGLSGQLKGHV